MEQFPASSAMAAPTASDFVPVAVLERAGLVESWHAGVAALVGPNGSLIDQLGAPEKAFFPRSAIKPLQAVAMAIAGLKLEGAQLAISVASHHGTPAHIDLVRAVLSGAGLSTAALLCPTAWPGNAEARALATEPSREAFNCSGKHAGFLAACVAAGWDTATYLDFDHPLQVLIRQVLEQYSGQPIPFTTIDGCGAPLHVMSVTGVARAMGRLAFEEPQIGAAMLAHPWAVGDTTTPDAVLMSEGLVAKLGAEGVMAVATPDGHGVCVKIADGSHRASALVAVKLLHRHGLITDASLARLNIRLAVQSLGGATVLGELRAL